MKQVDAASEKGQLVVLQPETNLNNWTRGVKARIGMRVQANPAFVDEYSKLGDLKRWGVDRGFGTIVGTCDHNSELVVAWDNGHKGSCIRAGKGQDFWLMTVIA